MILCEFNNKMDSKELSEFKRTWTDNIFGPNLQIKLSENILICKPRKIFGDIDSYHYSINVYGHNMIKLGEFHVDHGCLGESNYYPIIRFYNELNYTSIGSGGYNCGQPNNYSIESRTDKLIVTTEKLLEVVRESFAYIKIFE